MTESGPSPEVSGNPFAKEAQYWDARYKSGLNSGAGSYGDMLARKLEILKPLDFKSVTEIGCGDFNFGKNIVFQHKLPWEQYTGVDISRVIVERNRKFYPKARFEVFESGVELPKGDLLLCVDVLYHLYSDEAYTGTLELLKALWTKYLVLTAYERYEEPHDQIAIRKFDPAYFGTPKVREVIEADGEMYIYLFEK